MPHTSDPHALKDGLAKLGEQLRAAEQTRRFISAHYGMTNRQIGLALQGQRTTMESFAHAALAAKSRLSKRTTNGG